MKKLFILPILSVLFYSCSWQRVGSLTMVSTRNIESKTEYKLISKGIEGMSKRNQDDAMQDAIDDAVQQCPDGEFLKNAVVYIRSNGKKIKVVGDVWGIPSVVNKVTQKVEADIKFSMGDRVAFKNNSGKLIEGKIIGINTNSAVIEFDKYGKPAKDIIEFSALTKLQDKSEQLPVIKSQPIEKKSSNINPEIGVSDIVKWKKNFSDEYQQGIVVSMSKSFCTIKCKDANGNVCVWFFTAWISTYFLISSNTPKKILRRSATWEASPFLKLKQP